MSEPSTLYKWATALRIWGFVLSVFPVVWGTLLAVTFGGATFKGWLFTAALTAMFLIHHASNLFNDVGDFRKGIDQEVTPSSGGIVRGYFSVQSVLRAAWLMTSAGILLGLWIAYRVGPVILMLGFAGVISSYFYTLGPRPLKYEGLGDFMVFINFGVLGSLGAWVVQTGSLSWIPVVWSVPFSLVVVAVLHANNWRDIESDKSKHVKTVATLLGSEKSLLYYDLLIALPFVLILLFMLPGLPLGEMKMPVSFAVLLLTIPTAVKLHRLAVAGNKERIALDHQTARFSIQIAVFSLLGLGLYVWF